MPSTWRPSVVRRFDLRLGRLEVGRWWRFNLRLGRLEVSRRWRLDLWLSRLEVGRRNVVNLRFRRLNVGSGPLFNLHIGGRGAQGRMLLRRRPVPGSPGRSRDQRSCHEDHKDAENIARFVHLPYPRHEFSVLDAAKQRHW